MNSRDIVEMYKKGYSIDYIIKRFYDYKTKFDTPNHKFGNTYIITKKSISFSECEKIVCETVLKFLKEKK